MTALNNILNTFVQAAGDIKELANRTGDLTTLQTTVKSNLVNAVNELKQEIVTSPYHVWQCAASSLYSNTPFPTQAGLADNSSSYADGFATQSAGNSWIVLIYPYATQVNSIHIKATDSTGGWGGQYLNGATIEVTNDFVNWQTIAVCADHVTGEASAKNYQADTQCRAIRISKSGYLASASLITV